MSLEIKVGSYALNHPVNLSLRLKRVNSGIYFYITIYNPQLNLRNKGQSCRADLTPLYNLQPFIAV